MTEAKAHLSELMARVGYGGERFVIERRGRPLAALVGVEDLERLEAEGREVSSRSLGALALVGAWGEVEDRATWTRFLWRCTPSVSATPGVRWISDLDVSAGHRHPEQPDEALPVERAGREAD